MDLKERMREYQKKYIQNHSQLITCPDCGKQYKQYRTKYHPLSKKHIKIVNNKNSLNLKNNTNQKEKLK